MNTYYIFYAEVTCNFYSKEGYCLRCEDCGKLDDIHERMLEILIKHNFNSADACSRETGEVIMVITRT